MTSGLPEHTCMPLKHVPVSLALVFLFTLAGFKSGAATSWYNAEACFAATATSFQSDSAPEQVRLEKGSILYAELTKTLDAKKVKAGDPVNAVLVADVLAHGKIVVRHDAKLLGHITEAQVHSKEVPESRLGIVFDKIITRSGEVPFQSLLLAIRPAEHPVVEIPDAPSPMHNSAQGPMQPQPEGPNAPRRADSPLRDPMKSRNREIAPTGPTDIDGLSLSSAPNDGAQAIVSTQRTVKLESGVKIELRVTGQ
jgi:hypothetical protein